MTKLDKEIQEGLYDPATDKEFKIKTKSNKRAIKVKAKTESEAITMFVRAHPKAEIVSINGNRVFDPAPKRCEPLINAALERKGIEPDTVDVAALIDSDLPCEDNKKAVLKAVGASKTPSIYEYDKQQQEFYAGQGKLIHASPDERAAAFAQMRADGTLRGYDPSNMQGVTKVNTNLYRITNTAIKTLSPFDFGEGCTLLVINEKTEKALYIIELNKGVYSDYAMKSKVSDAHTHKWLTTPGASKGFRPYFIDDFLHRLPKEKSSNSNFIGQSKQKTFEIENKKKACGGKKLRGQQKLTDAVCTSKRLSDFGVYDPTALTIEGSKEKVTKLAKHLAKEHPSTKGTMTVYDPAPRVAEATKSESYLSQVDGLRKEHRGYKPQMKETDRYMNKVTGVAGKRVYDTEAGAIPAPWYDAMVTGIKKSSDVRNPYEIVRNIWAKLTPAMRDKLRAHAASGGVFKYDLPLPDDRVTKGEGTLRMVKPFKLVEAQVNVSKKDMDAVKKSGLFKPMKRQDGSICQVARCKSEQGNVNIFTDELR